MKLLIVDDEKLGRESLQTLLSVCGFEVHVACNFQQAIELIAMSVDTLAGPIETDDLMESEPLTGILAGSPKFLGELSELIFGPDQTPVLSTDPIGVQAADILARIYAICVNVMASCTEGQPGRIRGLLFARAAKEALDLTLAMGASPETFSAGSIPWTGTFVALAVEGPLRELGEKLGAAVKKGKDPARVLDKLSDKWRQAGNKIQLVSDIEAALACGVQREVDLPLLREAHQRIFQAKP